jgi:hypothetical protein
MKGGNVVQQIGQEIFYEVRNETGIQIPNGTAVYASGVTAGSGRITVAPYVADGSVREVRFLGIATENISTGVNGIVTHFGYIRGLDTRGTTASSIAVGDETWAVGDILYAHPTVAGKLTKVKPQHEVTVAIVITRHQSAGVIFVRPSSGGHLEDIHDILINTGSLATGQMLVYNSGTDYWENTNSLSGSYQLTGSLNITGSVTINESRIDNGWTAYTPQWTSDNVNPAIGNGTREGYYKVIGKTCFVRGNIAMGSTTTFGLGEWYVSMPFTASHADAIQMTVTLLDNGTAWYNATMAGARAGFNHKAPIQYQNVAGTAGDVNATAPFTWANGDRFIWNGSYEIA